MRKTFAEPAIDYENPNQGCSVTGGAVYRGDAIPWMRGAYLYSDYCSGTIWQFRWDNGVVVAGSDVQLTDTSYDVTCIGQGNDGELYVCDYGGGDARVYRIDPL